MGSAPSQTTQQSQSSVSSPWAQAQPLLQSLIDSYGGQSTAVTPAQTAAGNQLTSDTSNIPNQGAAASNAVSGALNFNTLPQVGMLGNSLNTLQTNLNPTASGANLDPYSTPGFSDALKTMTQDTTNAVKGVYAGSGRDPSGAGSFAQSLGRGITQGEAPVIASQANQNIANMMGANSTLFNAGNTTATGQAALGSQAAGVNLAGVNAAPGAASAYSAPGATALGAANASYQTPWTNLAALLTPAATIGSLGGQTSGSGTSTTTGSQSLMGDIMGGASTAISLGSMLMSDKRAKENIEEVGELKDGQKVHRFNYKGSPVTQVGLLAQDVAKKMPGAVGKIPGGMGMLHVDYRMATQRSAEMRKAA